MNTNSTISGHPIGSKEDMEFHRGTGGQVRREETLDQALSRIWDHDWRHRRSGATLRSQAEKAIEALHVAVRARLKAAHGGFEVLFMLGAHNTTMEDIQVVTRSWYVAGLSPATIQKRLNCLSKLGVNVTGCRVNVPKQLKWYLREDIQPQVTMWVTSRSNIEKAELVSLFIQWTTLTGLRVEESLRLRWSDVPNGMSAITVPGLKTASSQATLPLGTRAQQVLNRLAHLSTPTDSRVFPLDYLELVNAWDSVRHQFGWQDDPTATLKALRRSAARYLHVDCGMPLDMVRQYLRHEKIETTMEYLRLTGGYGTEEMRRYLK